MLDVGLHADELEEGDGADVADDVAVEVERRERVALEHLAQANPDVSAQPHVLDADGLIVGVGDEHVPELFRGDRLIIRAAIAAEGAAQLRHHVSVEALSAPALLVPVLRWRQRDLLGPCTRRRSCLLHSLALHTHAPHRQSQLKPLPRAKVTVTRSTPPLPKKEGWRTTVYRKRMASTSEGSRQRQQRQSTAMQIAKPVAGVSLCTVCCRLLARQRLGAVALAACSPWVSLEHATLTRGVLLAALFHARSSHVYVGWQCCVMLLSPALQQLQNARSPRWVIFAPRAHPRAFAQGLSPFPMLHPIGSNQHRA